jgi:hypothetical protein
LRSNVAASILFANASGGDIDLEPQRRMMTIEIRDKLIVEFTQGIKPQRFDNSSQFVPPFFVSRCPCQEQRRKNNAIVAIKK